MNVIEQIGKLEGVKEIQRTGSRVICNPPPTDTDDDYVVLVDDLYLFWDDVELLGYIHTSEDYENDEKDPYHFQCWRREEVNLIVTTKPKFFERWKEATETAKALNLLDKADRINHFTKHLYEREDSNEQA